MAVSAQGSQARARTAITASPFGQSHNVCRAAGRLKGAAHIGLHRPLNGAVDGLWGGV